MNVTPLDLRQQKFKTAMRGYDRGEVDALMAEVADDYEGALRDADRLRQEVARLESASGRAPLRGEEPQEHPGQRPAPRRRAARDRRSRTRSGWCKDAETRADSLCRSRRLRLEELQREIDGLKTRRRETETSVEAIINALKNTLDFVREQDARDRDDKIRLMRPRHADSGQLARPPRPTRSQNG